MNPRESGLSAKRRAQLVRKGQILYGKSCDTGGPGHCAESFARHQLQLGHTEVVRDLLRFLDERIAALRGEDPQRLLPMTESLAARIRQHLEQPAPNDPDPPSSPCPGAADALAWQFGNVDRQQAEDLD